MTQPTKASIFSDLYTLLQGSEGELCQYDGCFGFVVVKNHLRYMNEILEMNHRWEGEDMLLEYWGKPQVRKTCSSQYVLPLEIFTTPGWHAGKIQRKTFTPKDTVKFVEGMWAT